MGLSVGHLLGAQRELLGAPRHKCHGGDRGGTQDSTRVHGTRRVFCQSCRTGKTRLSRGAACRFRQTKRRQGKPGEKAKGTGRPSSRSPSPPIRCFLDFLDRGQAEAPRGSQDPPTPNTAAASSHALRALTEQPRETSTRLQSPRGLRGTGRVVRPHLRLAPHACGDPETKGLSHVSRRRAAEP